MNSLPIPATSKCTSAPEQGGWEFDGAWYETPTDALQGMFGFCGCGRPEDNIRWIVAGLRLITESIPEDIAKIRGFDSELRRGWVSGHLARCKAHFGGDEQDMFFRYWADNQGFTEHGGGLFGAWLSDFGVDFLAFCDREIKP